MRGTPSQREVQQPRRRCQVADASSQVGSPRKARILAKLTFGPAAGS